MRQSQHSVYAHEDDAFNVLLADERYLTAEYVDNRTSFEMCFLFFYILLLHVYRYELT